MRTGHPKKLHNPSGRMTEHEKKLVKVRRGETVAKSLERMGLAYGWGGARYYGANGHDRITSPQHNGEVWTDCSGGSIYLCQVMDLHLPPGMEMNTIGMMNAGIEGLSDYFTMFIKDDHMINRFRLRPKPWHAGIPHYRWWEVGGSDNPHPAGGASFFIPGKLMGLTIDQRLAEFPVRRCFPGL